MFIPYSTVDGDDCDDRTNGERYEPHEVAGVCVREGRPCTAEVGGVHEERINDIA